MTMTTRAAAGSATPAGVQALAQAFSTATIRQMARSATILPHRLVPVLDGADPRDTLSTAFDCSYTTLTRDYRNEYVYKNTLLRHAASAAAPRGSFNALLELPTGQAVADIVAVGATAVAYEIKTDLDTLGRLDLQLGEYSRCFEYVNVVASPARAIRIAERTAEHVGVLAVESTGALTTLRTPSSHSQQISHSCLFRILRRGEILAILQRQMGYQPDVPAAKLWSRTAGLFTQIPIDIAHREFVEELRYRDHKSVAQAQAIGLPESLYTNAYALKLARPAWRRLQVHLNRPVGDTWHYIGLR
ncbi:sce7726 family protein [Mycolicibacterium fortuitum]